MDSILSYSLLGMLTAVANMSGDDRWWVVLAGTMEYVPAFTLTPRLILSLRAFHERDVRGRCGSEIDIAFGFASASFHDSVASAITFADAGGNDEAQGGEQGKEIQMEELSAYRP